jgi:hypothetical protein
MRVQPGNCFRNNARHDPAGLLVGGVAHGDAGKCAKLPAILRTVARRVSGEGPDWQEAMGEMRQAALDALR